jgi:biopolymer transport protein ExbD
MHRRKRARADASIGVFLPITPMLDMVFQLLLFFIMNYHPSALEGQMELSLPASEGVKSPDNPSPPPPGEAPPDELPINITVEARVQQDPTSTVGRTLSVSVKDDTTGATPVAGGGANDPGNVQLYKNLTETLKKMREGAANKSGIRVTGDSQLPWEMMVRIMDCCRNAGFDNVGFSPPPDLNVGAP